MEDPDSFDRWEVLIRTAESLEGGLTRNSSPQSIASTRGIYDKLLAKYPLFYGYWKKYAELEFAVAGTEAAELVSIRRNLRTNFLPLTIIKVYERGIASIAPSVDLWTGYCAFKVETTHDPDVIRE